MRIEQEGDGHRDDGEPSDGEQGRRHAGKIAQQAEDERSCCACRATQRVEEAERAALPVVAHELGNGAVEHRRCAVEGHAHRNEQQHRPGEGCGNHGGDQQAGRQFGQNDGAQDADPLGDEPAHELARRAADEDKGESKADAGHARSLGDEQEGKEGEEAGAAGAVDELDGAQQREPNWICETPTLRRRWRRRGARTLSVARPRLSAQPAPRLRRKQRSHRRPRRCCASR